MKYFFILLSAFIMCSYSFAKEHKPANPQYTQIVLAKTYGSGAPALMTGYLEKHDKEVFLVFTRVQHSNTSYSTHVRIPVKRIDHQKVTFKICRANQVIDGKVGLLKRMVNETEYDERKHRNFSCENYEGTLFSLMNSGSVSTSRNGKEYKGHWSLNKVKRLYRSAGGKLKGESSFYDHQSVKYLNENIETRLYHDHQFDLKVEAFHNEYVELIRTKGLKHKDTIRKHREFIAFITAVPELIESIKKHRKEHSK